MPIEEPPGRKDSYVLNPESGAEMARLNDQHQIITKHMGGLFPPDIDLSQVHEVLDIACGPGGWMQDVAFEHRMIQVTGVDISRAMIDFASTMAHVQGLDNAHFQVADIRQPLDFDDNTFDFVNARFLVSVLLPDDWPGLLAECKRVLRPGCILRLTEADDLGISNSAALERLMELGTAANRKTGRTFFPYGRFIGTMFMIGPLLRKAGFQDVQQQAHMMDWSAGTHAHLVQEQNLRALSYLGRPFMLGAGVVEEAEFDRLIRESEIDMLGEDFIGNWLYASAWGSKPKE